MYSATALAAGDLVAADLPDAITLLGVGSLSRSGTGYGDTTDGVIFETPKWARYIGGTRTTQSCLITGDGNLTPGDNDVEDQFAAQYTVELERDAIPQTFLLTRTSLCDWFWELPGPFGASDVGKICRVRISYGLGETPEWGAQNQIVEFIDSEGTYECTAGDGSGTKIGNMNNPLGPYAGAHPDFDSFTVTAA